MSSKRTMVFHVIGLTVLALSAWGSFSYLESQEKPKAKEKEEVIEKRGEVGKKQNLGNKEEKNDPKATKVEKRAGAFTCDVHVDNRTPWVIHRVYIDRVYQGRVGRMGDLTVYDVIAGGTELYAEADFTDGAFARRLRKDGSMKKFSEAALSLAIFFALVCGVPAQERIPIRPPPGWRR